MPEFLLLADCVPPALVPLGLRLLTVHVEATRPKEGGISEAAVEGGLGPLHGSLPKVGQQGLNDSAEDALMVSGDLSPVKGSLKIKPETLEPSPDQSWWMEVTNSNIYDMTVK